MIEKYIKMILFLSILLLTAACVPTEDAEQSLNQPSEQENAYPGQDSEDLPLGPQDSIEPPPATLTIDGRSQTAGIGSYCWSEQSGQAVCADMIGIPTGREPLSAPVNFNAAFDLPLTDAPQEIVLELFPAADDLLLPDSTEDQQWWQIGQTSRFDLPPTADPALDLTLDPGMYVMALFAMWPEQGSVSYGFLVEIDGPAVSDGPTPVGEEEAPLEEEPPSDAEQGVVSIGIAPDGRSIYLPKQPPALETMEALIEGKLVEMDGCLRLVNEDYEQGFLILWPSDSDLQGTEQGIAVLNGQQQVIGRVGLPLSVGGGAMESEQTMAFYEEQIRGLPIEGCPGPYWVAAELMPMQQ